ncbi:hypothetical protein Taro_029021 [Colocasia esculenta]|uniref:Hexosyltransferase n=1 Tax=Colocasia esculenta TaxID=4460 RepID=A0A843VVY7_COLES|nr:hypothetical protein [Colocasia esculenta]
MQNLEFLYVFGNLGIGSPNRGDSLDRIIEEENRRTNDFLILEGHEEATDELPKKAKFFFSSAIETWDAEFYVKADDSINLDLGPSASAYSHIGEFQTSNSIFQHCTREISRWAPPWMPRSRLGGRLSAWAFVLRDSKTARTPWGALTSMPISGLGLTRPQFIWSSKSILCLR